MKAKYRETIFFLSALKRSKTGKRHISYKKVSLISNVCQPACARDAQPQPIVAVSRILPSENIPHAAEHDSVSEHPDSSSDYRPML